MPSVLRHMDSQNLPLLTMSLIKSSCSSICNVCIDFTQATLESPAQGSCDNLEKEFEEGIEKAGKADAQLDGEGDSAAMSGLATSPDAATLPHQTADAQVSCSFIPQHRNVFFQYIVLIYSLVLRFYCWASVLFSVFDSSLHQRRHDAV